MKKGPLSGVKVIEFAVVLSAFRNLTASLTTSISISYLDLYYGFVLKIYGICGIYWSCLMMSPFPQPQLDSNSYQAAI